MSSPDAYRYLWKPETGLIGSVNASSPEAHAVLLPGKTTGAPAGDMLFFLLNEPLLF
jgi:hypothetical protein